ncbi:hypothetical protein NAEGRDRAFT_80685 [Naegleria gruberi]|uniref:Uncharacterized protein n=1 Tax=Naegleria gruberi TaxID=5762 RepID=D2VNX1_NAEGR|nr:uncharacterized protein NAEGRDRAFT_80685 [Naegleria gruberi]EFC41566.1 hypothetical protein NAEGRDRAFT_80685 [Naegleria gruberi]|eukprot:XP_002674310.1 hypothetical protein NAEGRDRAFT_80685 [Naegleria gruberi strain NEG-M]
MSDAFPPFELDLVNAHKWMDFIHDRIGDDQLYQVPDHVPKPRTTRQEYNTFLNNFVMNGNGKFPKVSEKSKDSYRSTYDFHAEEGGKLSPLGRIWINQYQRKEQSSQNKQDEESVEETIADPSLLELIRGKLSFDLKFRIISMIPSTSRIVRQYENQQWSELFPDDFSIDCNVKDSAFVSYHKYRIISKEFNNRMQKKLMELDSLNLAKVFSMGQTPKQLENLVKTAYLLSFINSKRKYVLGRTKDVENINIYQDFSKIHSCLRSCCAEMNNLVTHYFVGGTLYFNSSIAFFHSDKTDLELEDQDKDKQEEKQIVQNEDTEEFGGIFVEPEYIPKDTEIAPQTEEDIVKYFELQDLNYGRHNFDYIISRSDRENQKKEYKKIALQNKSLDFKGNIYNNLILHLLLENGKEIPQNLDEDLLLSKNFKKNGLEEITFVNFGLSSLFECIKNSRHVRRVGVNDHDNLALFTKKQVDFRESVKTAVISSLENNVQKIDVHLHRDAYGIMDEIELICTHFPNVKEIRASILCPNIHYTPMNTFQNTTSSIQFKDIRQSLSYDLEKIIFKAQSCPLTTMGYNEEVVDAETVDTNPLFENTTLGEGCLSICFSSIREFESHNIESLEKELEIDLLHYPTFVIAIFESKSQLQEKKEIIDYFLERGFKESYFIDSFNSYSEDTRALEEYLIFRRKHSKNPILKNARAYSTPLTHEKLFCDIYLGLDLISNPQEFEKACFAAIAHKCVRTHIPVSSHSSVFTKLFLAKLFYENADMDLFIYYLDHHLNICTEKDIIEEAERWACDTVSNLSHERTRRTLQLFFTYISKPKQHTYYQHQKSTFNLDKISSYIALLVCAKEFSLVEACLTLAQHCFSNFNELFIKPFSTSNLKSKVSRVNNMAAVIEDSYGTMFEYETKIERRKELLKIIYHKGITDLETKIDSSILDENCIEDKLRDQTTNILDLLCSCVGSEILVLYAIDVMTSSQLLYQDSWGNTCLHIISEQTITNIELYEKIIEKQPKIVNVLNNDLNTVLHVIAYLPFPSLFTVGKVLVEKYGADKDLINAYGLTAYEIAMLTILESKSLNDEKHYDLSWLLPTSGKTKKDIFHKMILDKQAN